MREVERGLTWDYCNGQDYDLRGTNYTAADEKLIWCRSMFGVNWISQMEIVAGTGTCTALRFLIPVPDPENMKLPTTNVCLCELLNFDGPEMVALGNRRVCIPPSPYTIWLQ